MSKSVVARTLVVLVFTAIILAACADPVPEAPVIAPEADTQADRQATDPAPASTAARDDTASTETEDPDPSATLRWSDDPARQPWSPVRSASWRLAEANLRSMDRAIRLEAAWCAADPAAAELRTRLERDGESAAFESLFQTPGPKTLEWMARVFEATVAARDTNMTELPQVRLISRWDLRRWGCVLDAASEWVSEWDSLDLSVSEQLTRLLGWRHPRLTKSVERQLTQLYYGGWYEDGDDDVGRILIVSTDPPSERSVEILSHEIVHALQDQELNWNLHETFEALPTTDQRVAFRWVFEGDASATEISLDDNQLSKLMDTARLGDASAIGWDATVNARRAREATHWWGVASPYQQGADILAGIRQRYGWQMVNGMLTDPPDSTEQLLHLNKFARDEQPLTLGEIQELRAIAFPSTHWHEPRTDRMGEHWLRSFIHTSARSSHRASAAADGWASDELALWQSIDQPNHELITWQIVWDNPDEHIEGVEGLVAWLVAQSSHQARWARDHPVLGWDGTARSVRLIDTGHSAWLVVAADLELTDRVTLNILSLPARTYWQ